ncbi:MAG: hypothetical protein KC502_08530 [Myxococcales bacterium]|nr:hypothetical protein [Myxococcales bacterium]
MDLLAAFRQLQPLTAKLSPADRRLVQRSAQLLFAELHRLAGREVRGFGFSEADRDNVVQTILYRMVAAGPRGVREHDPQSADAVSGWLTQAVRNAMRDMFRKRKHFAQPRSIGTDGKERDWFAQQPADDSVDDGLLVDRLERRRMAEVIKRARTRLWAVLVPRAVSRKERRSAGAGARLHLTLEELRGAVAEGIDVGEVARRALIAEGNEPIKRVLGKRRTALDKRFQRAREALLAVIDEDVDRGDVDEVMGRALVLVVQDELYMQRRKDSLAARGRKAQPIPGPRSSSGGWPVG